MNVRTHPRKEPSHGSLAGTTKSQIKVEKKQNVSATIVSALNIIVGQWGE